MSRSTPHIQIHAFWLFHHFKEDIKVYKSLTSILSESGYHHPGSEPRIQGDRPGHRRPLQLLRIWVDQLWEAGIDEGWVLAAECRKRIHGSRVNSEEPPLVQSSESWLRQVEDGGLGEISWLYLMCICWVSVRRGCLGTSVWYRTVAGAPVVV